MALTAALVGKGRHSCEGWRPRLPVGDEGRVAFPASSADASVCFLCLPSQLWPTPPRDEVNSTDLCQGHLCFMSLTSKSGIQISKQYESKDDAWISTRLNGIKIKASLEWKQVRWAMNKRKWALSTGPPQVPGELHTVCRCAANWWSISRIQ